MEEKWDDQESDLWLKPQFGAALIQGKFLDLYFYEDSESSKAVTVTKERYTEMLSQIFQENSEDVDSEAIFQQDGAPAHIVHGNGVLEQPISNSIDLKELRLHDVASLNALNFSFGDSWSRRFMKEAQEALKK